MHERTSWDQHWLGMVYKVAERSHDPRTHVGAVIVSQDNVVKMTGYNGLVSGLDPHEHPELLVAPEKYFWCEHGERNAIYLAARKGVSLEGCKLYVNFIPCIECARGIRQSGIVEVIYHQQCQDAYVGATPTNTYTEAFKKTKWLFEQTGIIFRAYNGPVESSKLLVNGQEFYPEGIQ